MAFMRGEPLVAKLAAVAKYVVLPGTMLAALIYSPPRYGSSSKEDKSPNKILVHLFLIWLLTDMRRQDPMIYELCSTVCNNLRVFCLDGSLSFFQGGDGKGDGG
ncbi:hypothetical protein GH714_007430 [Hevea brasiliensis]|uniref:Uncharacterized protein n=1 Tax=Hevea brasiliensis TaxID=3981 RepID=A0A6A6MAF3_HEVBR|nr:hypothetical protein GH714_007430 [Hevea brasiliensis]